MDSGPITIRPIAESDLDEWMRLRVRLWDANSEDDHRSEMLEILADPESQQVFVAEAGPNNLVGFVEAGIRPFVEDCMTDQVGYLEGWYVEPAFRNGGVGAGLVKAAEDWARSLGCTEMASDAEIGNELGIEAHVKVGYQETSRLVHFRKDL